MAIFRFEAKIISRNGGKTSAVGAAAYQSGKCATSAAAYRAGEQMTDERTGQTFDYSKKKGVLGAEIMLPEGAPAWMESRSLLWNAVEAIEKRKDAQLARDFIISLPHELTAEQRRDLLREFVEGHLTSRGYVADCAYHAPPKEDGLNWHAHVMVPLRKVSADGFAAKKERPAGNPVAAWKAELDQLRQDWAAHVNRYLEAAGSEARVDHRSNAAQGLDREPEPKLGPIAAKIESEGRDSYAGDDLRDVRARNAERGRLKGELAGLTAEIIDLQAEREKRMQPQDGSPQPEPTATSTHAMPAFETTEARLAAGQTQAEALAAHICIIEAQASQPSEEVRLREDMNRRNQQQAEEAKKHEQDIKRQQEDAAANGDITDPALRYAQALGNCYSIRDPYASLAAAAMAEYGAFAKQQQQLQRDAHAEDDPDKKRIIELQAKIEGADYMAITHRRLAGMDDVIAGQEKSLQGEKDRKAAKDWKEFGDKWREERAELLHQQREYEQGQVREKVAEYERSVETRRTEDRFQDRYDRDRTSGEKSDRAQARAADREPRESGDRQQGQDGGGKDGAAQGRASGSRGGMGR